MAQQKTEHLNRAIIMNNSDESAESKTKATVERSAVEKLIVSSCRGKHSPEVEVFDGFFANFPLKGKEVV